MFGCKITKKTRDYQIFFMFFDIFVAKCTIILYHVPLLYIIRWLAKGGDFPSKPPFRGATPGLRSRLGWCLRCRRSLMNCLRR